MIINSGQATNSSPGAIGQPNKSVSSPIAIFILEMLVDISNVLDIVLNLNHNHIIIVVLLDHGIVVLFNHFCKQLENSTY